MRVAYIVCSLILDLALIALAVTAPIWITPDYYWWTAFALLLLAGNSFNFTERLNKWDETP